MPMGKWDYGQLWTLRDSPLAVIVIGPARSAKNVDLVLGISTFLHRNHPNQSRISPEYSNLRNTARRCWATLLGKQNVKKTSLSTLSYFISNVLEL